MSELGEIYVRTRGTQYGPFNESDLLSNLKKGLVPFSAWVFRGGEWTLLAALEDLRRHHPEFEDRPNGAPEATSQAKNLPAPESASAAVTISADPVWFVVRDKKKYGPFSAAELVGQLQRKQLEPGAFVWRPGFATWQRLSSVAEFSRESMKKLASGKSADSENVDILVKRKTRRVPYEVEIVAHDNTRAIEGRSMVIGEGGLFLATERPKHKIGARLRLHFREGRAPSFNAVAEVVSVVRGSGSGYCLRFIALSDSDRKKIAKLVKEIS